MSLKSLPNCRRSVRKDVRLFLYAPHSTQYYSIIQSTEKYYSRPILYFSQLNFLWQMKVYIYIYFFMLHPYSWIQTYTGMSVCCWIEVMLWWVFVQVCTYISINIIRKLQSFFPQHSPCRSTSSSSLLCNEKQHSKLHFSHSAHRASKQVFALLLLVVNGFTRISFCSSHRRADDLRDSSCTYLLNSTMLLCSSFIHQLLTPHLHCRAKLQTKPQCRSTCPAHYLCNKKSWILSQAEQHALFWPNELWSEAAHKTGTKAIKSEVKPHQQFFAWIYSGALETSIKLKNYFSQSSWSKLLIYQLNSGSEMHMQEQWIEVGSNVELNLHVLWVDHKEARNKPDGLLQPCVHKGLNLELTEL